ncbi:hypothetical protein ABZ235_33970 [Streptomyces canus]|uniref:hypothetical protein n=1 Tax=Streptomyces canus TaxID=58343 RepID=UPI0033AB3562
MGDDKHARPPAIPEELGVPEGFVLDADGAYRAADDIGKKWEARGPYVIPLSLDGHEVLSFEPRRFSGWAAYLSDELDQAKAYLLLRIGYCDDGPDAPFAIREVRLLADRPATFPGSSLLRALPWERIEAAVNQPSRRAELAELVPLFHVKVGSPQNLLSAWALERPMESSPEPELRLDVPDGYRKPDAFYAEVAERFLQVAAISPRPAQELAEANDMKPTTVHRWIREAKARGLLALPGDRKPRASDDTT